MLDVSVLFTVFNRPDTTQVVFERIRQAKPRKLFLAADGPRPNKDGEKEKCDEVKRIVSNVDWDCDVYTLFREENLGSGKALSSAITWFFSHVEMGIILEDDCLPDVSFFSFCKDVLEFYKDEEKVMHVSGGNLQCGIKRGSASYYLSKLPSTWGWATWRRAWKRYSFVFFEDSDDEIKKVLTRTLKDEEYVNYFFNEFEKTKAHVVDAWDYQWVYTLFKYDAICVTPQYSLIRNIGFNSRGTHTFYAPFWYKYLIYKPAGKFEPVKGIELFDKADDFYLTLTMGKRSFEVLLVKLLFKIKNFSTK
ncbi:nucleotide-diphospho-sugar transferase [Hymenobacter sp. BT507]|uniref:Nucleotide-diphospho-sugar transferase n=1 Tax=Hymenobacter citatus TaxID=2763506 RepID=A0ABR7MKN0_9BACT|nr:nucleotide-diphospho-sugar transferase [Hymenobacter citatus]MBC6611644.1 nucleotide-diphospho-sugar transferase [Hymenobacter citatus]